MRHTRETFLACLLQKEELFLKGKTRDDDDDDDDDEDNNTPRFGVVKHRAKKTKHTKISNQEC